jgi:hypothetical protein
MCSNRARVDGSVASTRAALVIDMVPPMLEHRYLINTHGGCDVGHRTLYFLDVRAHL